MQIYGMRYDNRLTTDKIIMDMTSHFWALIGQLIGKKDIQPELSMTIECEGMRWHSILIFLMLLLTKPNIEVSGWLFQTKTHITHIVYQPFTRSELLSHWLLRILFELKCRSSTNKFQNKQRQHWTLEEVKNFSNRISSQWDSNCDLVLFQEWCLLTPWIRVLSPILYYSLVKIGSCWSNKVW